ncbi:MAG: ABC transporter substrate-binding protein [Planctomycetota bacterium]
MSLKSLRIGGVPEHFNLPWHLACEAGAFADAGLDVEYRDFPGGTGAMTGALKNDELNVAIVLSEGGVANVLNGAPNRLCKVYVDSPLIWGIHVPASSRFETMDEARGSRYAISRFGSGSHLMAIVDAAERGWELDALQFVKVGGLAGALAGLPAGDAELFMWERFMTQPHVDDGTFRRIDERPTKWPSFMICATLDLLESRADELRKALEIVSRFCKNVETRSDNVQLIADRYSLSEGDTAEWLDNICWSDSFDRPDEELAEVISYLQRLEIVKTRNANPDDVWFQL